MHGVTRGYALTKLGRYDEVIEYLDKAMELDPQNAWAWYSYALFHSDQGKKEKALPDLKKAIELDASFKEKAKKDENFKGLWADEEFKRLVE